MGKARLEAFSDGVIAIIITIMVLELRVPAGESFSALIPLFPVFVSYVLSFVYVGIYWNNHHHMLHRACYGLNQGSRSSENRPNARRSDESWWYYGEELQHRRRAVPGAARRVRAGRAHRGVASRLQWLALRRVLRLALHPFRLECDP